MSLLQELKRRNVLRAAVAYIVTAWLVIQVVETIVPAFGFGDSAVRVVIIVLAIGLVPALILAWVFRFTPEGLKLEEDAGSSRTIELQTSRKMDGAIIAVLTLALAYFVFDEFVIESAPAIRFERSIAVLPFTNRSANVDDVYFVDGIHDDILTQLANLSGLDKVISRTSTQRYRDTTMPIPQIGEELGVAHILEGGVQRAGDRVRINMQLIVAATDEHLWADTYDRELTIENLFAIQSEIAREVVSALQAAISDEDDSELKTVPTNNLEACNEVVLGRRAMARCTAEGLFWAQAHFEKAIELDGNYALAYIGLADAVGLQVEYAGIDAKETFALRQAAIDRAVVLNPGSGEAYTTLGWLQKDQGYRQKAELSYRRAISLSPNYATAYHWYTLLLRDAGRYEEGVLQIRKGLELNPAAPILTAVLAEMLTRLGRAEEAQAALLDGLRRNPEFPEFHGNMAMLSASLGRLGEAAVWVRRANQLSAPKLSYRPLECSLFVELEMSANAERCLDELRQLVPTFPRATFAWTSLYRYLYTWSESNTRRLLADADIMNAEWRKARPVYKALAPEFFGADDVIVQQTDVGLAIGAAATMWDGEQWEERANYIADRSLATMRSMHRTRGLGYGFVDVFAHRLRGDEAQALAALRAAIDSGCRLNWWVLRMPAYDIFKSNPDWDLLIAELEADVAKQRQWFEANRDVPLH